MCILDRMSGGEIRIAPTEGIEIILNNSHKDMEQRTPPQCRAGSLFLSLSERTYNKSLRAQQLQQTARRGQGLMLSCTNGFLNIVLFCSTLTLRNAVGLMEHL